MDGNACRAGEVERKVRLDNDFSLRGKLPRLTASVMPRPPAGLVDSGFGMRAWCALRAVDAHGLAYGWVPWPFGAALTVLGFVFA
jgi:hypothetical protein